MEVDLHHSQANFNIQTILCVCLSIRPIITFTTELKGAIHMPEAHHTNITCPATYALNIMDVMLLVNGCMHVMLHTATTLHVARDYHVTPHAAYDCCMSYHT